MLDFDQNINKACDALRETDAKLLNSANDLAQANQQIEESQKRILASKTAIKSSDETIEGFHSILESDI